MRQERITSIPVDKLRGYTHLVKTRRKALFLLGVCSPIVTTRQKAILVCFDYYFSSSADLSAKIDPLKAT